jgi:hypothetical protein
MMTRISGWSNGITSANCRLRLKTGVLFGQMAGAWVGILHYSHRSVDCRSTAEVEDSD